MKLSNLIGGALTVGGLVFVALQLAEYRDELDVGKIESDFWLLLFFLSLAYTLVSALLIIAWRELLAFFEEPLTLSTSLKVYGTSQIAKYLPGNIFHIGSRQVLGISEGIVGWKLAKASGLEIILILIAALCFLILLIPLYYTGISWVGGVLLFIVILLPSLALLHNFLSVHLARCLVCYIAFLAMTGITFYVTANQIVESSLQPISLFVGAYVVAWMVGFITPGAPAGLGVREVVLMIMLKGAIAESDLLLSILLARGISLFGDFWLLIIAKMDLND